MVVERKISEVQNKIEKLNEELELLKKEKKALEELPEDKQLAIALHDLLCHWNHTDGCSWFYEIQDKVHQWGGTGSAHNRYLNKARKIISVCKKDEVSVENALKIIRLAEDV